MKLLFIRKNIVYLIIIIVLSLTKLYSQDFQLRQEYVGNCDFSMLYGKPGYKFLDIIDFDTSQKLNVSQLIEKIQKEQQIKSLTIGILVYRNIPTNKISSLEIICEGDKSYNYYIVICFTNLIESNPSDKIENQYRFTDKVVIEKNFEKIKNETSFIIHQYKRSKLMGPVPDAEPKHKEEKIKR